MSKSHKNEKTKKKVAETQDLLYKTISRQLIKSGQTVQKNTILKKCLLVLQKTEINF